MGTKKKIGRNDPCPCGSGKKYKKCHIDTGYDPEQDLSSEVHQHFQLMEAKEYQRKQQQGLGRSIISTDFQGRKRVAVGNEILESSNWKTFYDTLADYIKHVLGKEWFTDEASREFINKHPILQWYEIWKEYREKTARPVGEVFTTTHIGASRSFFKLAHNLYLIQHNEKVQSELIRRLKLKDQQNFHGALYETYVAAFFINAGFEIDFEDELDNDRTHCEFTATHKVTKRKFSVEAKTLKFKAKGKPRIVPKLRGALKKEAGHERIVFIDLGKPSETVEDSDRWIEDAKTALHELESSPKLKGEELPPAYVIFTNHSYWYDLNGSKSHFSAVNAGFKIPTFTRFKGTMREILDQRKQHQEVLDLIDSMGKHTEVPITFDGENPEITFGENDGNPRLFIGNKYNIPCDGGTEIGILKQVTVMEDKKQAIGIYDVKGGGSRLAICSLSDTELAAYKKHPDTFFGKIDPQKQITSPLEFYDRMYDCFKNSTKENLLKFMKDRPDYSELTSLPQEELAKIYCEGITEVVISSHSNNE